MGIELDIELDEVVERVVDALEQNGLADDIADRVRDDLDFDDIVDRVVGSYSFDNAVNEVVNTALGDSDIVSEAIERSVDDALEGIEDTIREIVRSEISELVVATVALSETGKALTGLVRRIATLEAALASAGTTMQEPARRVLHGVEVSATTTGLF